MNRRYLPYLLRLLPLIFCIPPLYENFSAYFTSLIADDTWSWSYGQGDFIEYWSAFQLLLEGQNPYSPPLMLEIQKNLGPRGEPMMMWNPPWLLIMFAPLLSFEFSLSAKIWSIANVVAFWSVPLFIIPEKSKVNALILLASFLFMLCFPPFWMGLKLGQISGFLTLGTALYFLGIKQRKASFLGFSLLFLSLKVQLFLLPLTLFAWWILKERSCRKFILSAGPLLALIIITLVVAPNSLYAWVSTIGNQHTIEGVQAPNQWITASLSSVTSYYFFPDGSPFRLFFSRLMSLLPVPILFGYLVIHQPLKISDGFISLIVLLSVVLSPFCWFFDNSILIVPFLALFHLKTNDSDSPSTLVLFLLSSLLAVTFYLSEKFIFHHQLFWFAPLFLILLMSYLNTGKRCIISDHE